MISLLSKFTFRMNLRTLNSVMLIGFLVSSDFAQASPEVTTVASKFKAAVYEHVVISPDNAMGDFTRDEAHSWMSKNLQVYDKQIAIAAEQDVDIIVFPEYGITGFDHSRDSIVPFLEDIPDPTSVDWIPCTDPDRFPDTLVLNTLSCLASRYRMYIVVNMGDIKSCDINNDYEYLCPADGRFQFNTNVVFDSDGRLIARYHKWNLYDESPLFDTPVDVEYVTFDTPFGKFATIVCFDIMHYEPTQVLLNEFGVTNLLVTSAWNVFYPFVMPTQMYSGLSKRNNINLIASNIRNYKYVMAGSGIYGKGVEVSSEADFESSEGVLLISELKNDFHLTSSQDTNLTPLYNAISDLTFNNETYEGKYEYGMNMSYVILRAGSTRAVVCKQQLCCIVDYKFKYHDMSELFILGAVDFEMFYPGIVHMQFCAVHPCASNNRSTCGDVVANAKSTFEWIKIQAMFRNPTKLVFPFVGTTPFENHTVIYEMENYKFDKTNAILESDSFKHPLLSAVIFNTIHKGSVEPNIGASSNNEATPLCSSTVIIVLVVTLLLLQILGSSL